MLPLVLLLIVVGMGAVVLWASYGGFAAPSQTAADQAAKVPQAAKAPQAAQASDEGARAINELMQLVKDLQVSQQQVVEQLQLAQRQLAAEQGERKLLSEQLSALSGRVDGLSAAPGTTGTAQSQKKKPAPH